MSCVIFTILGINVFCFQSRFAQALEALPEVQDEWNNFIKAEQWSVLWDGSLERPLSSGNVVWLYVVDRADCSCLFSPQLGKSSLVWTLFRKACGLSCWRRCSSVCPASSPGGMRSCCSWMSSTVPWSCTPRTVPCWGSTLPRSSTQPCTLTTSSPSAGTSGSSPACYRWAISMNNRREEFLASTLLEIWLLMEEL